MKSKIHTTDKAIKIGIVTKRLFDGEKYKLYEKAVLSGKFDKEYLDVLLELASKPLFKENFVWRIIRKYFGADVRIPFLTGFYTLEGVSHNLITVVGTSLFSSRIASNSTDPVTAVALGTGTTAADPADTTLETEKTDDGLERGAATLSLATTTTTNDTRRYTKTFFSTDAVAVTEEGLFNNNTSGGSMLARQVFPAVNLQNGDALQIVHDIITAPA